MRTTLLLLALFALSLSAAEPALGTITPNTGTEAAWASDVVQPTISGSADPFSQVTLSIFGSGPDPIEPLILIQDNRLSVDEFGNWSATILMPLSKGIYQVQVTTGSVRQALPIDNISARILACTAADPTRFTNIDPDGGQSNDWHTGPGDVVIHGRAEAGATLTLESRIAGTTSWGVIDSTTVTSQGHWAIQGNFTPESYEIRAAALTSTGVAIIATRNLIIDDAPAQIQLTYLGIDTGSDPNDGITSQAPTHAQGVVPPGSLVTLTLPELDGAAPINAGLPGSYQSFVFVDSLGNFQADIFIFTQVPSLLTYRFTTAAPNGSTTTLDKLITIDQAPLPLLITGVGTHDGSDPSDGVVTTALPIFTGTSEPGAVVTLSLVTYVNSGGPGDLPPDPFNPLPGGGPIEQTIISETALNVTPEGTWSFDTEFPLVAGAYELRIRAKRTLSGVTTSRNKLFSVDTFSWSAPAPISYGTVLDASTLNATPPTGTGTLSYSPVEGTILNAGEYILTATWTPNDGASPQQVTVPLTVNPAPLVLRADDQTRTIGFDNPTFTVSLLGLVGTDTPANLPVLPTATCAATTASAVGNYDIVVEALGYANYTIQYEVGTLTITGLPNDNFANAQVLHPWSGSIIANTMSASRENGEPLHANLIGGRSLWYQWTAPADGQVEFNTFGSNFDTLLNLYAGTELSSLKNRGNNNDSSKTLQSKVLRNVLSGQTYYIAVDGKDDSFGTLALTWMLRSGSDRFTSPLDLGSDSSGSLALNNEHGTTDPGEPVHGGVAAGHSIWCTWTAPTDGTLAVDTDTTLAPTLDTVLGIYTGTRVNRLTTLAFDDDDRDAVTSAVGVKVTAGTIYLIMIDGNLRAETQTGPFQLNWTLLATPTN